MSYPLTLTNGWNLIGNSLYTTIDVGTAYADVTRFTTVWKWNAGSSTWAFYAPSLAAQGGTVLQDYAASKSYSVLASIAPGEGYWVNTGGASYWANNPGATSLDLGVQTGQGFFLGGAALLAGWNLVATADDVSAANFNRSLSGATTGCPTNVTTLWAWDNITSLWYFYAPSLDCAGTLTSYNQSKGYEDFGLLTVGKGRGLWANVPNVIAGGTSSYYLSSAAYLSTAVGATIYSKNLWYETTFHPVGTIQPGSKITSSRLIYSTSSPPNQPSGFEAKLCNAVDVCTTVPVQDFTTTFLNGGNAANNSVLKYRVFDASIPPTSMAPVYGASDSLTVVYDYPVYISSGSPAALTVTAAPTTTTKHGLSSTLPGSPTGKGNGAPPTPR